MSGSYDVDSAAGTVTHHIECGLIPAQVGTALVRWIEIDGGRLTLHTSPPTADGMGTSGQVRWQRIE